MTAFVPSFSSDQLLPPWISQDARSWIFLVSIARENCQAYLDTRFNAPGPDQAPFRYEALTEQTYGMFCVVDHPNLSSGAVGSQGWDTVSTHEVFWLFPARRWRITPDNLKIEPDLVWIKPFTLVDNSYVMFSSREIWGDESDLAKIVIETGSAPDDIHIDVAIQCIKHYSPRAVSHLVGYFHVQMEPGCVAPDPAALLDKNSNLAAYIALLESRMPFALHEAADPRGEMALNTLKQFRDVFDMRAAIYRALVASRTTHTNVRDPVFYDGTKIAINAMWSDSTSELLGTLLGLLPPQGANPPSGHPAGGPPIDESGIDWNLARVQMPVAFGVSFTSDARFEVLETLHCYSLPP